MKAPLPMKLKVPLPALPSASIWLRSILSCSRLLKSWIVSRPATATVLSPMAR